MDSADGNAVLAFELVTECAAAVDMGRVDGSRADELVDVKL
jgi:hypothetical protein